MMHNVDAIAIGVSEFGVQSFWRIKSFEWKK
jgi:hypothetical protein